MVGASEVVVVGATVVEVVLVVVGASVVVVVVALDPSRLASQHPFSRNSAIARIRWSLYVSSIGLIKSAVKEP